MNRERALELLGQYIKNERMVAHSLAAEAVMKALALRLGRDEDAWATAGLLHDLDIEITSADLKVHGLETEKILRSEGVHPEIIDAIVMHNEIPQGKKRASEFQHALAAAETVTGLVVATALVYPDKKLASVKPKSVLKRMKEKAFAASVSRENIMECEEIGVPLNEFVKLSVDAMKEIAPQLGL
ncbi:MAG TPA: hydrolase [Deltaproteobacteria bacterium]|nr:hydrolase [Deltaproteobacteria bacterium]